MEDEESLREVSSNGSLRLDGTTTDIHTSGCYKRVVVGSALGFFLFGYDTGVVSGASKWMQEDLEMSTFQKGVAVGITCIFAAIACTFAGILNEKFGRRKSIMISSMFFIVGACGMIVSQGAISAIVPRACLGVAIGIATTSVPLYVAECVPPGNRGQLLILNDLCVAIGQVTAGLCNVFFREFGHNWRASMGLAAVPALIQLVLFMTLPESPRWLASKGKTAQASDVFRGLMGTHPEAEKELDDLLCKNQSSEHDLGFFEMWRTSRYTGVLIVGIMLQVMNQASGINTVMYYSASILEHSGFEEKYAIWGAVACTITQSLGVTVSITRMDVWGRRFLAILSSALVAPFIGLLAVCFAFLGAGDDGSSSSGMGDVITVTISPEADSPVSALLRILVVTSLAAYLFSFGLGLSGVPWTMNAEIFPHQIRNKAQAQSTFTNWFLNGIIAIIFPVFMDTSVVAAVALLLFFGLVALTGCVWFYYFLPETMQLTLEEIEDLFSLPLRDAVRKGRTMQRHQHQPLEESIQEPPSVNVLTEKV